jgi:hypothetical protein
MTGQIGGWVWWLRGSNPGLRWMIRDTRKGKRMVEYKVLTQHDSRFAGKFDEGSLEAALNSLADDGWRVVEALLAASLKRASSEIVVILERPKS